MNRAAYGDFWIGIPRVPALSCGCRAYSKQRYLESAFEALLIRDEQKHNCSNNRNQTKTCIRDTVAVFFVVADDFILKQSQNLY